MGHIRLGRLPDTKPWRLVVAHIASGEAVATVAASTSQAAVRGLRRGRFDRGVGHVVFLLARTALAARQPHFADALADLGILVPAEPTLFDLTSGFTAAMQDWHSENPGLRTDLGEMATLAAVESLVAGIGARESYLIPTGTEVRDAVRDFSTLNGFATLGHDYFSRFTRRFLLYHLGRELSQHVGGCGRFTDPAAHTAFLDDLDTHCRQAAVIVRQFAGEWYSKARFEQGITESQAQRFSSYCLKKIQDELERRGVSRG